MDARLLAPCLVVLLAAPGLAQPPDTGSLTRPVDEAVGQAAGTVVPPAMGALYDATGERFDREDIRIILDLEFLKGDVDLVGFVLGSGRTEVEARLTAQVEFRILSTDRIRAVLEGDNAFNMTDDNSTFLRQAYAPADVLRATFTPELLAYFEQRQEAVLEDYVRKTFPELELRSLRFMWENTTPMLVIADDDLTEPPITANLEVSVLYTRTDSVRDLLAGYFDPDRPSSPSGKKAYIKELKQTAADPIRSRDFFSAAAYSQLLNLSAQPGWAIDVDMTLPKGYSFTYFNNEVIQEGPRSASLHVDALDRDDAEQKVFLASITHKRGVAAILFGLVWIVALVGAPLGILYDRRLRRA